MNIIDSELEYNQFITSITGKQLLIYPIYVNEFSHPRINSLCLLWVYCIDKRTDHILFLEHNESVYNIDINVLLGLQNTKFIVNKKNFLNLYPNTKNLNDIELISYIENGTLLSYPEFNLRNYYINRYPKYNKCNCLIPVSKYIEYFNSIKSILLNAIDSYTANDKAYEFYNDKVLPNLSIIENNGLYVKSDKLSSGFVNNLNYNSKTNFAYTQYNIYTVTGRPSNRYGGLNFSALNKETGIRDNFVPRKSNNILVEFDYEAYHLRIIANLVGVSFDNKSVHTELAKLYFNKTDISPNEYEESKNISFRQLYGGILKEYENIELFKKAKLYIESLWYNWNHLGYIESVISGRRLYKKNYSKLVPQKLFNYYIQLIETEMNIQKISDINLYLQDKNTKLILYTYDSFLFDFDISDGKQCYETIKKMLIDTKYLVRSYIGHTYGKMQKTNK